MWNKEVENSPLIRLFTLVKRDRDDVDSTLVRQHLLLICVANTAVQYLQMQRALDVVAGHMPNLSVDLMYCTPADQSNNSESQILVPGIGLVNSVYEF